MDGAVHGNWGEEHLNLRISKENLSRALLIMDALLKGLDERGCKTSVSIKDQLKTEVDVNGIKIEITLREDFKRYERNANTLKRKTITNHIFTTINCRETLPFRSTIPITRSITGVMAKPQFWRIS